MSSRALRCRFVVLSGLCALLASAGEAAADGFVYIHHPPPGVPVPPGPGGRRNTPLEVRNHNVTCTIRDRFAVTTVDQVFHNPFAQQLEGEYMFPMPERAAVQKFSMWMNGKEVHGEILDAEKARKTYEEIVMKSKDPALLEYVGSRLYRARIFPIPASGDVRVQLEYSEDVVIDSGLGIYRYPLNTEKFSSRDIESVTVKVDIRSEVPLKSVFCPSHETEIRRPDDRNATVAFEARRVRPDRDFILYYQTAESEFGLSLLSYRPAGEDGFFMARIAPPIRSDGKSVPKDICFVLDTSGSMSGEKIEQAKRALKYCLQNLRADDRFNVIFFATDTRPFRDQIVPADRANVDAALEAVAQLRAAGGTDINEALRKAVQAGRDRRIAGQYRPYMIAFITDGEPTVGEQNPDRIRENVREANEGQGDAGARLFVFGVGHDLNTKLLDTLAEENRGTREYIDEKENIEVKVSRFYEKIADPALCEIQVDFGGADVAQVYPKVLPDLFHGGEIVLVGRYRAAGRQAVKITGKRGSEALKWEFPAEFATGTTPNDFLPRLWATRKIGFLMDEIRLRGEKAELKDEVVQLAKRYGIVTPYTSFLVVEDEQRHIAANRPAAAPHVADAFVTAGGGMGAGADHGLGLAVDGEQAKKQAVRYSMEAKTLSVGDDAVVAEGLRNLGYLAPGATTRPAASATKPAAHRNEALKVVGDKTFYLSDGRWVDSRYDGKAETKKVKAFSDDYFRLLREHKGFEKYFALGARVVVVADGRAYETVE